MTDDRPLQRCEREVECPYCLALRGERCVHMNPDRNQPYRISSRTHMERVREMTHGASCSERACRFPAWKGCPDRRCYNHHRALCASNRHKYEVHNPSEGHGR